jgi:hypothetical protein
MGKEKYFRTWYEIVYKEIGKGLAKSAVWEENPQSLKRWKGMRNI